MTVFKKGDRVRFIDEVGEGTVLEVLPDEMLLIEDSDGFDNKIHRKKVLIITDGREEEQAYKRHTPSFEQIVSSLGLLTNIKDRGLL